MDSNEVNKGYTCTPIEEGCARSFQENVQKLKKEYNTSSRIDSSNNTLIGRNSSSDEGVDYGWAHSSSCDFI